MSVESLQDFDPALVRRWRTPEFLEDLRLTIIREPSAALTQIAKKRGISLDVIAAEAAKTLVTTVLDYPGTTATLNIEYKHVFLPEKSQLKTKSDDDESVIPFPSSQKLSSPSWGATAVDDLFGMLSELDSDDALDLAWDADYEETDAQKEWDLRFERLVISDPTPKEEIKRQIDNIGRHQNIGFDRVLNTAYDQKEKNVVVIGSGTGFHDLRRIAKCPGSGKGEVLHLHEPIVTSKVKDGAHSVHNKMISVQNHKKLNTLPKSDLVLAPFSLHYFIRNMPQMKAVSKLCTDLFMGSMPYAQGMSSLHITSGETSSRWNSQIPIQVLQTSTSPSHPSVSIHGNVLLAEPGLGPEEVSDLLYLNGFLPVQYNSNTDPVAPFKGGDSENLHVDRPLAQSVLVVLARKLGRPFKMGTDFTYFSAVIPSKLLLGAKGSVGQAYVSRPSPLQPHELPILRYGGPYYVSEKTDGFPTLWRIANRKLYAEVVGGQVCASFFFKDLPDWLELSGQAEFVFDVAEPNSNRLYMIGCQTVNGHPVNWGCGYGIVMGYRDILSEIFSFKPWCKLHDAARYLKDVDEGLIIQPYLEYISPVNTRFDSKLMVRTAARYVKRVYTLDTNYERGHHVASAFGINLAFPEDAHEDPGKVYEFDLTGKLVRSREDKLRANHSSFIAKQFSAVKFDFFMKFVQRDRALYKKGGGVWPKPLFTQGEIIGKDPATGPNILKLKERLLELSDLMGQKYGKSFI
jgi:hypothetical protein